MKDMKRAKKFLDEHKALVGFDGWDIDLIDATSECDGESAAKTTGYEGARKLVITLLHGWDEEPGRDWKNILMHELICARVGMSVDKFKEQTAQIEYLIREDAVNDITRGFRALEEKKGKK